MNTMAIIFDLGGVILNIDYNRTRLAFENLGIKNFNEMYSQAGADELFMALEKGTIDEINFYNEIRKRSGLFLSDEQIRNAWNALLLDFREGSLQHLDKLQLQYNLFLLSNTNKIHLREFNQIFHHKIRKKNFEQFFQKAYYSCDIGLRKPDADCFEHVLQENNLNPAQTIFIDDSLQNVAAAQSLGLHAILLKPGNNIENLGL